MSRVRLHSFPSRLTCRCWTSRSLVSFQSYLHLPTCPISQTSATTTSFGGSGNYPFASARWIGMSSRMTNPTLNKGSEPNFYSYLNEEHTTINFFDSFQCRDDATTPSFQLPRSKSSLLGSIQQEQTNRSSQSSHQCESLTTAAWVWQSCEHTIGTDVDWASVDPTIFSLQSEGRRDRGQNGVHSLRDRENLPKNLERKVDSAVRGENGLAKTVRSWSWGETLGKTNSDFASQEMKLIKQEVKNYRCNNRRILRLWVRWWFTFGIYRTKWIPWPMQEYFTILNEGAPLERPTIPTELLLFSSSMTLPRCDSGLSRNTHNCTGIVGNVFERPPAQEGLSLTIFHNSRN